MKKIIIFLVVSIILIFGVIMGGSLWWANNLAGTFVPAVPINNTATTTVSSTLPEIVTTTTSTLPVEEVAVETPTTSTSTLAKPKLILIDDVPFTVQAPSGEWSDPLQQDGCEEAAVLMALTWAKNLPLDKTTAKKEIIAMSNFQIKNYGQAVDTNVYDTVARLVNDYWNYTKVQIDSQMSKAKIISALIAGQLVLVPANGQLLNNPNYKGVGPLTHMLVIKGYDEATDEFITNDSGTRKGEGYRYPAVTLLNAVVTYPTGNHGEQDVTKKSMIIISR